MFAGKSDKGDSENSQDMSQIISTDEKGEEATGAFGGGAQQDVKNLQGNFEEQQAMIGQLREMLRNKEESKKQEKEFEDYATRLAKMKPRLTRRRGREKMKGKDVSLKDYVQILPKSESVSQAKSQENLQDSSKEQINVEEGSSLKVEQKIEKYKDESENSAQSSISQQETNSRSRVLLLRKQLEENRIKFERQQRENLDKRAAMEDMKERIEKLRMEVEQRDTVIQSLQEVDSLQPVDPNIQHLYQQILHKDNTILELADKVNHLEGVIHDQFEQINEKDQVIAARTEAVTLITKDKDEKLMKTIQELEDVRISLKSLHEDQKQKEKQWNEKETSFEDNISLNIKRISILEDNYQKMESIRFELNARNAELQEKLVFMQCDTKTLRQQLREHEVTSEERSQEMEEMKKKLVRAEAFGQKKLKALEKQIKSLSTSEANFGDNILQLQNKIAELEEEKGNLQLKLVDFDEIKLQNERLKESVVEYGNKTETLNSEILSQIGTITQHEKEKIAFIEELNAKDLKINNLEETISREIRELDDVKQNKITLELRLCEIEEERDLAQKERKELENEYVKERESQNSEEDINTNFEEELKKCVAQLEEKEFSLLKLRELVKGKDVVIQCLEEEREEKQNENQCLISFLAEKESLISSQSIKLENHDSRMKSLHEEIFSKDNDIKNIHIQGECLQQKIDSLSRKLNEADLEINELRVTIDRYKEEVDASKNSISLLAASEQSLRSALKEKESIQLSIEDELVTMREELNKKEESISSSLNKIDHMDSVLQSREKEILNLESEIADKLKEISQQETKCRKYEEELEALNRLYQETISKLKSECDVISCLLADKENQVKALNEHVEIKIVELKNSETMSSKFEQEICEKNKLYDILMEEKNLLLQEMSQLKQKLQELEYNSTSKNNDISVIEKSLEETCNSLEDLREKFDKNLEDLNSKDEYLISLEAQNNYLKNELHNLESLIEAKEHNLQQINNSLLSKEKECSSLTESLLKKDSEINELRVSLGTAPIKEMEITEYQSQVQSLENLILEKDAKFEELHKELEGCSTTISQLRENICCLETESKVYKNQAEEFSVKLEQSTQELTQQLNIKEQEILYLQKEIENRNGLIITLQSEDKTASKKFSGIEISELQCELANKISEVEYLKKFHETELQDIRMQNMKLKDELTSTCNLLSAKDCEFTDLKKLYDDQNVKISHFEVVEKSFGASLSREELEELKNKIAELEIVNSNLVKDIASQKEIHLDNRSLHPDSEISCQLVPSEKIMINVSTESELSLNYGEVSELYLKENEILKKQLEEAQQAIIRLETSLATETNKQSSSQEGLDEWGIVDLGEPSISDHSKLSMQTSLVEKDKALTVTQEQLKIALEEVNAANDEKKIVQHQMNTLEAELSHKDKKIYDFENLILDLKKQVTGLEMEKKTSSELTSMNIMSSQSSLAQNQQEHKGTSIEGFYSEQSASSWFKTYGKAESTDAWNTIDDVKLSDIGEQVETQNLDSYETPLSAATHDIKEAIISAEESKEPDITFQELQYKLSWYEENWATWTEHYTQLQINLQTAEEQIVFLNKEMDVLKGTNMQSNRNEKFKLEKAELEESLSKLNLEKVTWNELNSKLQSQLERANQEIYRLKDVETQVNELQGNLQTLQHQCSVLEIKSMDSEENASKVREYEMLYGEIQTCMHEAETKREGSKSRVQELELMVQSAESEIARLRQDLERLTKAGNAIEEERNSFQVEIENLKEEVHKSAIKRESFEKENDRLQREASTLHLQCVELQDLCRRHSGEIDQLKSEVEILEGENERNRSNYDILEADLLRLRHENEGLTQNYQILGAEKESLETEIQRLLASNSSLTFEKDRIRGEAQRITEVATSAESEIARLKLELENFSSYPSKYKNLEERYFELEEKLHGLELLNQSSQMENTQEIQLEEVDWGTEAYIEDEHLRRSSNIEKNSQELKELKEKVITLEKEKYELNEEIQTQKLKNGKLIQKLKAANNKNENLLKEIQKLKAKAGGFSDLDVALEEEWKSQISKVESERDELKIKVDELEKEKNHMKTQLDVLDMAQDKYLQLKESQDGTIRSLSSRNENLASQIASLEWKISELEENLQLQNQGLAPSEFQTENSLQLSFDNSRSVEETLQHKITSIEEEIHLLKSENAELVKDNGELQLQLKEINNEKEEMESLLDDMKDAKSKLETNCNTYKTSYLELHTDHETLQENYDKLNKELESIKEDQATLKSAYDVLYEEYHQLQENRDSVRLELGIISGERDKLQEEVYSLNNQLQALQEEEEEEIIKALQDECADLREQNNNLKDEITRMNESVRQMEETVERTKHSLDQEADIQDYLRNEIITKSQQNDSLSTTVNQQEQQLKYQKAEIAALKSKSSQQQQALEILEPKNEELKKMLESVQEQNIQLSKQVEAADFSLVKLATRSTSNSEGEERFSSLEATELEAALSSLHIRDLRCQQLSLEINKLLEERDGLQLKLSAALRQNQDLTRELSLSQQLPSPQSSTHSLSEKLAELRDLNNSLEQKALDSFRGNISGMLPPSPPTFVSHTAPATPTAMRHLDYTVTRENQGASSTIMNWILGKSTPKEVLHV